MFKCEIRIDPLLENLQGNYKSGGQILQMKAGVPASPRLQ